MSETINPQIAKLHLSGKETSLTLKCNQIAYDVTASSTPLLLASVAGPSSSIKALRVSLTSKTKVEMVFSHPERNVYPRLSRHDSGYEIYLTKLPFNTWHMLAIAKRDGLLTGMTDDHLWSALRKDSVTTPMLREWLPYIREELDLANYLSPLQCFGCEAAVIDCSVEQIDQIIARGVQSGNIRIQH